MIDSGRAGSRSSNDIRALGSVYLYLLFLQIVEIDGCGWPILVPKLTVPEEERPCLFPASLYKSHGGILISAWPSGDLLLNKGSGDGEVSAAATGHLSSFWLRQNRVRTCGSQCLPSPLEGPEPMHKAQPGRPR